MPVVGLAEVLVEPVFTGTQRRIASEMEPAAKLAGRAIGRSLGTAVADGLAAETPKLQAEVTKMGKAVSEVEKVATAARKKAEAAAKAEAKAVSDLRIAQEKLQESYSVGNEKQAQTAAKLGKAVEDATRKVEAARQRAQRATDAEARSVANLEIAHTKLQELQAKGGATQSQLAAATERVNDAQRKLAATTEARVTAETNLIAVNTALETAQGRVASSTDLSAAGNSQLTASVERLSAAQREVAEVAERRAVLDREAAKTAAEVAKAQKLHADAEADLKKHMREVDIELEKNSVGWNRLAASMRNTFRGRPIQESFEGIGIGSRQLTKDLDFMSSQIGESGTRGGRAFTRGFLLVSAALTGVVPLAGAASGALLATAGAATTLASSLQQLGGVAALAPAALISVGAAAGTLKAAFAGMGEALTSAIEMPDKMAKAAENPRIAAMAVEDATRAIQIATENAAESQERSARRIADAQQNVIDVTEQVKDSQAAAARAVEQANRQVEDSVRRVEDAHLALQDVIEGVQESRENAARSIESAQRREARSARDVLKAQRDLNEARKEAIDRVKEVADELQKSQLRAKETALALQIAEGNLQKGTSDPASSKNRIALLELAANKAKQADEDAKRNVRDLIGEQKIAKQEAVTSSEKVRDAEERLADARYNQAEAIRARKDAQKDAVKAEQDGARSIAKAQRDVEDAIRAQTDALRERAEAQADVVKADRDGARAIAEAQQSVADAVKDAERSQRDSARNLEQAHRSLERVQLQQGEAARNAGEESVLAMNKLSPAAQEAARALLNVYDRLKGVQQIAQENFFTGFAAPLLLLADTVIPQLEVGVGRIATALGAGAQQLMTSLTTGLDEGVLLELLTGVAEVITILNGAIDPLVQAFITLGQVGMPYMEDMAVAIRDAADRFNTFIQTAAADGSLNTWIDNGIQGFKDIASIAGSISGIFSAWNDAARAGGIDVTLGSVAAWLADIEEKMQGEVFQTTMTTLFEGAAGAAKGLGEGLKMIGDAFVTGAPAFAEFNRLSGEIIGLFTGKVAEALANPEFGAGLTTFLENVKIGLGEMDFTGLTSALGEMLEHLGPLARDLGPTLVDVFTNFAEIVTQVLIAAEPFLTWLVNSEEALTVLIGSFLLTAAISAILTAAINIVNLASLAFMVLFRGIPALVKGVTWVLKGLWAVMSLNPVSRIITIITALIGILIWFFTETEIGRKIWATAMEWIKNAAAAVADWFNTKFVPTWKTVFETLGNSATEAWKIIEGAFKWIGEAATGLWEDYIKPAIDWIVEGWNDMVNGLPEPFRKVLEDLGKNWDQFVEDTKKPIDWIVDVALNKGLIAGMNFILGSKVIDDIPWPPKGWKTGGYTGSGNPNEAAGIVHKDEFVFNSAATNAIGKEKLAAMMWNATHSVSNNAATTQLVGGGGGISSQPYFMGNVNAIKSAGSSYFMNLGAGVGPWNFQGAARLWDGASGLRVKTGSGRHQGYVTERERGGGILGYATGTNIDMSPSWKNILGPKQRLTVAAHEAGHAIGLPHDTMGRSIMAPLLHQMAAVPTSRDIQKLQYLYPGGSGKAGSAAPENPLVGMVADFINDFRKEFPKATLMIDAISGVVVRGINRMTKWIDDIKNGIINIANDVVSGIKDFFGVGATVDRSRDNGVLVRDGGGVIPPGWSHIFNGRGENEFAITADQAQAMANSRYVMPSGDTYNVELPRGASVDDLIGAVDFEKRRVARGGARR